MARKITVGLLLSLALFLSSYKTASADAICNDGTYSYSSGSGTCSHHGGVDYWIDYTPPSDDGYDHAPSYDSFSSNDYTDDADTTTDAGFDRDTRMRRGTVLILAISTGAGLIWWFSRRS